jgi:SSS family solute:Na+ symporter
MNSVSSISTPDLVVVVVYLLGITGLGLWVGRKNTSAEQFTSASGKLPGWAVGLSIFGTFVSSISFLAYPGKAYAADWNAFVFSISIPLAAWVAVKWFVPFYRRSGEISAYHHLEARFGAWARTYAVFCYLLTQLGRMGTITYLLAIALQPLTGWSLSSIILLAGCVVLLYSFVGGIEAVIWTDVIQSVVLIGGTLACLVVLIGGLESPMALFGESHAAKFGLGDYGLSLNAPTFWVVLVYGLVINLQNFGIDQSYVQRYATARSEKEAASSVWLGALLYVPISALFLLVGTALFAYYGEHADKLPVGIKADEVFPFFIKNGLPVGMTGLLVAAIFAAAQSTLSSSVNCAATLVYGDLYQRYYRPRVGAREALWVLRISTLVFGVAGTLVAFWMIGAKSALDLWWKVAGVFSGGMLGLFLLGILARRAGNMAAGFGVTLGVLVIAWMTLSSVGDWVPAGMRSGFDGFLVPVFGTAAILLGGFLVGWMAPRKEVKNGQVGV